MPELEPVDLVLTDPPYNFTTASSGSGKLNPWADICNSAFWFSAWVKKAMSRLETRQGALWECCNWRTLPAITKAVFDAGYQIESLLVWDKCCMGTGGQRGLRPRYELVALICHNKFRLADRSIHDIQKFQWASIKPSGHPAEKPISLFQWLLEISGDGITIDPFFGSGTTGIACEKINRHWIGIEMSEEYCELSANRIEAEASQLKLFV